MPLPISLFVGVALLVGCGGTTVQTRALDGDESLRNNKPLEAVAYYDLALDKDIPNDHPLAGETRAKRTKAVRAYLQQATQKADALATLDAQATHLRSAWNTAGKLEPTLEIRKSKRFSAAFDKVVEALATQALRLESLGQRLNRLEYLAGLAPKGNPAEALLEAEKKTQYQGYVDKEKASPPALAYFFGAAARRIRAEHTMPERPDTSIGLALGPLQGNCGEDLQALATHTSGSFTIPYTLEGVSCTPEVKRWEAKAKYTYQVKVPKTTTRQVRTGETCTPTKVSRTHHVCLEYKRSNSTCVRWGIQQTVEDGTPKCEPRYEDVTQTVMVPEDRQGERLEQHLKISYRIAFKVRYDVGDAWLTNTREASESMSDLSYSTEHGQQEMSLDLQKVKRAAFAKASESIIAGAPAALAAIGDKRFALATTDEERAQATLMGAPKGNQWIQGVAGVSIADIAVITAGETLALVLPAETDELPQLKNTGTGNRLRYDDSWKGGTNILLSEGTDLTLQAMQFDEDLGPLALRLERRTGIDDFRTSFWGLIRSKEGAETSDLGWGIGYRSFHGNYDSATSLVFTQGMHYEQHKADGRVSFRSLSFDYNAYLPLGSRLSLDAGVELNAIKVAEWLKKGGAGDRIDHGWPAYLGASAYLARSLSLGVHAYTRFFSDISNALLLSLSARM